MGEARGGFAHGQDIGKRSTTRKETRRRWKGERGREKRKEERRDRGKRRTGWVMESGVLSGEWRVASGRVGEWESRR